jgi:hypothetical protein
MTRLRWSDVYLKQREFRHCEDCQRKCKIIMFVAGNPKQSDEIASSAAAAPQVN